MRQSSYNGIMRHTEQLDKFKARIERFLKRTGMAPGCFGREAMGDPTFVFDLRNGKSPRPQTMDRAELYIDQFKSRASSEASLQAAE